MSALQVAEHGIQAEHGALDRLREALAAVLARDVPDIGLATSWHRDLAITARQKSEFLLRLERCFGLVIEDDEASWLDTIADAIQLLCLRGAVAETDRTSARLEREVQAQC